MNYRKLGNTDLDVSTICLGTMTWGEQNTQEEGFEQMDYALDHGVNFGIQPNYMRFLLKKKLLVIQKKLWVIGFKKQKRETR